ncbi:MAG TPA: cytochrome C biosynthesis protein [Novosphingobium sp.]|nr:cytochrome C biosynthesis protein [Novosphingobium sp.]
MTWIVAIALALAVFALIVLPFRAPRSGWEAIGMALALGVAGYAWQAHPGLPGAPKAASQDVTSDPAALVDARRGLSDGAVPKSSWVVVADGLARNGQFANAAGVLLGEVEDNPKNADAWLAMANTLVAHADGLPTPAALYAYRRAREAAPESPGPPFFLGLAYAQAGRLMEARAQWAGLLARSPADAPWRADLAGRMTELDRYIAAQDRPKPAP